MVFLGKKFVSEFMRKKIVADDSEKNCLLSLRVEKIVCPELACMPTQSQSMQKIAFM